MRLARLVTPEGTTMDDWRIAAELALRFGTDFGFETVEDVQDEIARVAPAYAGVDAELLRRARDGAVLPIAEFPDEIVFHARARASPTGVSWEPIPPGVAADESHLRRWAPASSTERHRLRRDDQARARVGGRPRGRGGADAAVEPPPTSSRRGRRCTSGTARRRRRPRRRPTRTVSASWPPARSTTPDASSSSSPSLAALATGVRARRAPERPRPHRGRAPRATTCASPARAAPSRCRCSPTPPPRPAPRSCRSRSAAPSARTTSSTSPTRSPSSGSRRRGERGDRPSRSPTRCSTTASTPRSC